MAEYEVGQLIHHRRYDYRGVVAGVDSQCTASEEWYRRNRTQPDRTQPWYHVLVDGGSETYVAEENLEQDTAGKEVEHPFVRRIFALFLNGRYHRNCPN